MRYSSYDSLPITFNEFLSGAALFEHLPSKYGVMKNNSGYVRADTSGHVSDFFVSVSDVRPLFFRVSCQGSKKTT